MSLESDRQIIESRLNTNWVTTDIAWDSVDYTPTTGTAWIACSLNPGEEQRFTMGSVRQIGILSIQIFTPISIGANLAYNYADTLAGIFRNALDTGVQFKTPTIVKVGKTESWFQVNVNIPYWRQT